MKHSEGNDKDLQVEDQGYEEWNHRSVASSLCAGVVAVASWLWANRQQTSAPGPGTLPLLGNVLDFLKLPILLHRLTDLHKQYGDVFRFYVGPTLFVVVMQPGDIKRVLITGKLQQRDPFFTYTIRKFMNNGLITNSGEIWERHHKIIEPAFHFSELEKYLDTFNKEAHLLNEKLAATGGAELDVYSFISLCTLRCVSFALGGLELDRVEPDPCKQEQLSTDINRGLKTLSVIIFRPWKAIQGFMWMSSEGRELKRLIAKCRNFTQRSLDILREDISNTKATERTYLASILEQEDPYEPVTDDEVRDEMLTLALAGSETTASAMCYTLALLGLYPQWQEKAWRQLDQVFGTGGDFMRPLTTEDLSQLTVIDAIIKESLRLFPPVPVIPRLVDEDVPLARGRHVAPRSCRVLLALSLMHRHPQLFPDPDKFDPGRFLPGGSATSRKSCSYLPFSTGPRRCLGGHFATMEMKILLSTILRRFRIIPGSSREELEETLVSITSHPLTGYRVSCVPREMPWCK